MLSVMTAFFFAGASSIFHHKGARAQVAERCLMKGVCNALMWCVYLIEIVLSLQRSKESKAREEIQVQAARLH